MCQFNKLLRTMSTESFFIKTINVSLWVSHIFRKIASRLRQIRLYRFSNSVSILGLSFSISHLFWFSYNPILAEIRNKIQQKHLSLVGKSRKNYGH